MAYTTINKSTDYFNTKLFTGNSSTNAITGVACAWYDSIPMIVISGQQKRELIADYTKYRNLGPQEVQVIKGYW